MSFEITQERPKPKLWLAKPNKQIIQRLNGIENLNGKFNFMNENELTFNINSYVFDEKTQEQKKNPALSKIKNKYLLKFTYNGQEEWFIIDSKTNTAEEKDYIPITARYIGSELDQKQVGTVEEIGKTIRDMMNQFLPVVAKNWSVRYIDDKLASVQREYNLTDASIGSILAEISEQTDAVIVFHNKDRQLSFIHKDNAGRFRGLKVKETTYLKSFTDAQNSQDLVTRLILEGKEGLSINSINPAGTSYIDDFSYYLKPFRRDSRRNVIEHSDYMSDELAHALLDFNEYFENRQGDYEELSESYTKLLTEQLEEDFKLSEITATLNNLEERIEVLQPIDGYAEKTVRGNTSFNVDYNMHYMMLIYNNGSLARVTFEDEEHLIMPNEYKYIKIKTPKQVGVDDELLTYPLNVLASNPNLVVGLSNSSEADFEEDDVDELDKKYNVYKYRQLYAEQYAIVASIEKRVDSYNNQRQNINESLSAQNFFTPQLQEELENFTHWGVWREENHTDPKELLEDGREQLSERNNIDRTTTVNIIDFVQSLDPEDQKNWDKLVAGDKIRFSSETYEADLEAFISELNINFDDNDVSLTLSDVIDLRDKARGASQVLASFVSTSNQVNMQKKQLDENAGKTNQVMALLEAEWDANKRRILAGNETVDIGSHGIRITSPTHPNEMLVAVAGVISISDDYGETFKQAINTRGVVAERLIGKVILGTELIMENNSGTFRFDDDGVRINAEHFHLIADDGQDYFDNLLRQLEQEFVTYEERIKADMEQQEESFKNEISDVSEGLEKYTDGLLDALADGVLTQQEINMLQMQMNMLEADYAQARRRIIPIIQSTDVDIYFQEQLYQAFQEFEKDYETLLGFINNLNEPEEFSPEIIQEIKELLSRFKPGIEEIIALSEINLEHIQTNRIANAEYNSRTFAENLMHDLEDEIGDLNDALEGFDLGFEGAVADGVLDMVERANISDALLRVESEKANVDNRYAFLSVHEHIVNTDQLRKLQNAKQEYNTAFNNLINRINYVLAREKITPDAVEAYRTAYEEFSSQIVNYSQVYEESLEFVQNRYADTQRGEAEKYADGLKLEVDSDIADVHENIGNFADDVYGAFADGIITERERARLQVHHDMLEKEKSDVIERYNTIITSPYLQGFYDTEALVQARARYGDIHADLLLDLELAMMDDKITKEEADQAVANFEEYVERLTAFSVELELAIAALGESKAVYQTQEELKNYIELSVFNDEVARMQATLDGHIMTWYYDHEPTLNNEPAVNWTDSATRERHVGDLFYYGEEGFAYRFMKKPGGGFEWIVIKDNDITKALADAQDAIDLADSKRRVFIADPTPPYDIGDLWIMDDGELMRARKARAEGEVFLEGDWIKATKYTDDTKANAVENMLNDFQEVVNGEFEDLVGTFDAFQKTIEGAFKDGIIEDYELKILHVQAQSLDREKADVDALYNQLLDRSELNSSERSTLVSRYSSFSSTHMSLINNLKQVIEDGVIDETEYNVIMTALDDYPVALKSIKEYMNEVLNNIIERVSGAVDDIAKNLRLDEWETTSFAAEAGRIASMVSESSWEETYLPIVNKNISGIGTENLVPYANIVEYIDQWSTSATGSSSAQLLKTSSGNAVYDKTARVYTSNINDGDYFALRSKPLVKEVVKGETYTLSFKTTNHASSNTGMTYTYLMNEAPGTLNQGSLNMNTVNTARADGVLAYHHTVTFQANFSGVASLLIGTRSTSDVGSQFHLYDLMFVKGTVVPEWSSSPMDLVEDLHNNVIKREYSTTEQTKGLISSEVSEYNLSGYLDKLSSGYSEHDVSSTAWSEITEANGSLMDDAFSYEITARRTSNDDTLFVAVFNSRGRGNGWDRVILEQKGTTGFHPQVYNWSRGIRIRTYSGSTLYAMQVVYQKYAGSFTNLDYTNSQIEQKADEINLRVTNKTIGGGKNMIPYSSFPEDEDEWGTEYSNASILEDNVTNHLQDFAWVNLAQSSGGTAITISTPRFNVVSGRMLTLSFKATRFWNCYDDMRYIAWIPIGQSNQTVATPVKTELVTDDSFSDTLNHYEVQTTPNFSGEAYLIIGTRREDSTSSSRFYIKDVQLEEGVTSTAWSPSPNDSLERYSEIKQTAESISSTVSKKVGEDEVISKINQSAEEITIDADKINITGDDIVIGGGSSTKVRSAVNSAQAQADAARDGDNIAKSINSSANQTRVQGSRIRITGQTEFTNPSLPKQMQLGNEKINANALSEWGITTISGGKIQADQMTAKRIKVIRKDGLVSIDDGMVRADYQVNGMEPHFRQSMEGMAASPIWENGTWYNTSLASISNVPNSTRTTYARHNAFYLKHNQRYLVIPYVINQAISDAANSYLIRVRFFDGSGISERNRHDNVSGNTNGSFKIDLGTPDFKSTRAFYLEFRPNTSSKNHDILYIAFRPYYLTDF